MQEKVGMKLITNQMTKTEALEKTKIRFTNLIDGTVRNGIGVSQIISHYESLLNEGKPKVSNSIIGNIERRFLEDEIREIEEDLNDNSPFEF